MSKRKSNVGISERKETEKAQQSMDELFRALIENSSDIITILDPEGIIRYESPSVERGLGYKPAELIGTNIVERLHPDDVSKVIEAYGAINAQRTPSGTSWIGHFIEARLCHKDGLWRTMECIFNALPRDLLVTGIVINFHDITKRKQADEALRESEEKFRSMVDNVGIGVALISPAMEILDLNRQMRVWFPDIDSSKRLICYRAFNNPPREEICDYCPTCRTLQDGNVHEATTVTPTADGPRNYRTVSSPVFDANRKVTACIEMVDDITERVSLEAQLRQAQKMEAIGTLAGGVAHDFNNILTTIIGYADLMLMTVETDKPLTEEIEEIKLAGERAAALTRQLLAFSRKQIVQPRILDLNKLLTDIEKMFVRLIGEDIEILITPGSGLWKVEIDPGQMEQVIMNLAVNARDAMPNGGKLTIETVNMDLGENYFTDHGTVEKQPGSYVLLTVSDTGIGMDKGLQEHIFDPFYTTKEKGKGTGLGLSTIYGIVKQNNGFIWVYSEPGQGSTFKIYLPKVKRDVKKGEKEQTPIEKLSGSETVLIVEDDNSLRKLAQKSLQPHGYRVLVAENGEDALRISKEHEGTIDLLITDVVMPRMGGKEVAERLQTLYPRM